MLCAVLVVDCVLYWLCAAVLLTTGWLWLCAVLAVCYVLCTVLTVCCVLCAVLAVCYCPHNHGLAMAVCCWLSAVLAVCFCPDDVLAMAAVINCLRNFVAAADGKPVVVVGDFSVADAS